MWWLSAQYCARQNATGFLELWGLLLVLCGAAVVVRRFGLRFWSGALFCFALLSAVITASMFYGCSATAANEQGLPSDLAAGTYTFLRCLGTDLFEMVQGWVLFVASTNTAIALAILAIRRPHAAVRISAFAGAALMVILAFAFGFFLLFGLSWCESQRLM